MSKIKSIEAGFVGETYTDRFLHQMDFSKNHAIFKGLHIQTGPDSYLQVDTLIITQKYIAILEIKNIKGKVYF
ncbi:NERD domain-containing protein, partial [Leptospira santarosai]|nr:NERD domain-containing protein [Leptospira santarosai]